MALVVGTNCGFVTTAPTADPAAGTGTMDTRARGGQFTSPTGATTITEIGWYCDNATEEANFEVGVYTDDADLPGTLLDGASQTNAKGTNAGWKVATGLNITITGNTIYWLGVQLDDTATATNANLNNTVGSGDGAVYKSSQTTLPSPTFGTPSYAGTELLAIYAVYTTSSTINTQVIGYMTCMKGYW